MVSLRNILAEGCEHCPLCRCRRKPRKVLARLFHNNDQLKTNTALQMKDAEIDFKII